MALSKEERTDLSEAEWDWARKQYEAGLANYKMLADHFGVAPSTISRHSQRWNWGMPPIVPRLSIRKSGEKLPPLQPVPVVSADPSVLVKPEKPVAEVLDDAKELVKQAQTIQETEDPETKDRTVVLEDHKAIWREAREKIKVGLDMIPADDFKSFKDAVTILKYIQAGERLAYGLKDQQGMMLPMGDQKFIVSWADNND